MNISYTLTLATGPLVTRSTNDCRLSVFEDRINPPLTRRLRILIGQSADFPIWRYIDQRRHINPSRARLYTRRQNLNHSIKLLVRKLGNRAETLYLVLLRQHQSNDLEQRRRLSFPNSRNGF